MEIDVRPHWNMRAGVDVQGVGQGHGGNQRRDQEAYNSRTDEAFVSGHSSRSLK